MEVKRKYILILVMIGISLFLFKIGERDLWEPDETRYALVAREMRECGNWIVPHLNGALYQEKPPLFFWLVNLSTFFCGAGNELTNRLPSALAGLLTLLITFHFASKLFNPQVGFFSGLVLATSFFFPQISRWMMLDSVLCLCFLVATYYLYLGIDSPKKQRVNFLLAGIFVGLGTLTKGPVGFLPIPIFLTYSLILRKFRRIWNWNLLYSVMISVGLVLLWFLPATLVAGRTYQVEMLSHQIVGRFVGGWSHPEPFYFYFVRFPLGFLPWTFFLPLAFHDGFSCISNERREEFLLLFVWFSFVFFFFTLSKGKNDNYILPVYPAAAILVGNWLASFSVSGKVFGRMGKKLCIPIVSITLLFAAAWLLIILKPFKWFPRNTEIYLSIAYWPLFLIAFGGVLSIFFVLRGWTRLSIFCFISSLMVAQFYLSVTIPSRFNEIRSMKSFSRRIQSRMKPDNQLKIWKFQSTGLLYYTGIPVERIRNKERFLQVFRARNRVFMVVEKEDLAQLEEKLDVPIYPIERAKVGHQELFLISNQKAE